MIRTKKHITFLLLFLLIGTLTAETAIGTVGLSQITSNPDHVASTKITCAAGFILSSDVSQKKDATNPFVQKQDQTYPEQEKHLITSNCQSSLQWIAGPDMTPLLSENSITYESFVYLHASQTFVFEIADPPRFRQIL